MLSSIFRSECPCCQSKSTHFQPLHPSYLEEAKNHDFHHPWNQWEMLNISHYSCQNCGASDRDRFMGYFMRKNTKLIHNKRVIEFAPSQPISKLIQSYQPQKFQTADKYMPGVDLKNDLTKLDDIPTASCDLFICSHVLEHIEKDRDAMKELLRILSPEGVGILIVPLSMMIPEIIEDSTKTSEKERWKYFGQGDHVRLYERKGFVQRLKESGFAVKIYESRSQLSWYLRWKYQITPTSSLYLVTHPGLEIEFQ